MTRGCPWMRRIAPHELFHGEHAHSLHKGTLDLSDIDGWVEAAADVHEDVSSHTPKLPRERVHLHLSSRCPVRKVLVHESTSRVVLCHHLEVVRTTSLSLVVSRRTQINRLLPSQIGDLGEGGFRVGVFQRLQAFGNLFAGVQDGHAVDVRTDRGRRRRSVGGLVRGTLCNVHLGHIGPQRTCSDLNHLDVEPLTHFGTAVTDEDAPVCIHQHTCLALIEESHWKCDPIHCRHYR
mmetsp:Transcript_41352/g.96880  ORF Transcript_41352/g.96880 Transcript_41352/m.96880 type:complete len:235 (-) Transcript_41352:199-903(-)